MQTEKRKKDGKEKEKSIKIYLQSLDIARSFAMGNKVTLFCLFIQSGKQK